MAAKKAAPKKPQARAQNLSVKVEPTPTERLEQIGIEAICAYITENNSLRSWAIKNGFVQQTVINWIEADEKRSRHYARARDERADFVFESLDDVSDQAVKAETAVEVAGLRLKSDNIKWKLARMNAKKYGDKMQVGGAEDLPPIRQDVTITPEEAYRRMIGHTK